MQLIDESVDYKQKECLSDQQWQKKAARPQK